MNKVQSSLSARTIAEQKYCKVRGYFHKYFPTIAHIESGCPLYFFSTSLLLFQHPIKAQTRSFQQIIFLIR